MPTSGFASCVAGYAARLHAAAGTRHHVASPLGAWLLLALAGPASSGGERAILTEILGCDVETAAHTAAELLGHPHPVVASAAAVWTQAGARPGAVFERWRGELPATVTTGDLPDPAGLDAWAREHTLGLIDRFPVSGDSVYLVLASALATKVSWTVPFELVPAASLGEGSPWARQLSRVLRTPTRGHTQYVAATAEAGDVIVHVAAAAGGLAVVSVAAAEEVPASTVLEAAHQVSLDHVTGARAGRREVGSLPLGEAPLWRVREVTAPSDICVAVLPAWSASSDLDLADPALGFAAARAALLPDNADPWQARQAAMARYSRTGFEAAAVTAFAVTAAARIPARRREAELRFAHPYAVVAVATDQDLASPWHGLPVFSAWVAEPEDATGDDGSATAIRPL